MTRVTVVSSTDYTGMESRRSIRLQLSCGHARWSSKRLTSVVCRECKREAARRARVEKHGLPRARARPHVRDKDLVDGFCPGCDDALSPLAAEPEQAQSWVPTTGDSSHA